MPKNGMDGRLQVRVQAQQPGRMLTKKSLAHRASLTIACRVLRSVCKIGCTLVMLPSCDVHD